MTNRNEILIYQPNEINEHIEVRLEDETVWLTQMQMATLFGQSKQNISLHINNCFKEGELEKSSTVKKSLTVQIEGKRKIHRTLDYYNLDVIISVGYRVKSKQGTLFRIWATNVLRDYLLKGYAINQRIERIENNYESLSQEVNKISLQLKTQELPNQGLFYNGQVYDAYELVAKIIRSAEQNIILIDNYIDENTITLLTKKAAKVKVKIYTKEISKQLSLDIKKANEQFGDFDVIKFTESHDRFLIIDKKELYHLGASLKDLGKKWFAFSRIDYFLQDFLFKLEK